MADTPAAPTPPAIPAAAPAAPAPAPAAPAATKDLLTPKHEPKPKLSARKALGLEDSVSKLVGQEIKKAREKIRKGTPVTAELAAPEAPKKLAKPAPAAPAPPAPAAAPAPVAAAPAPADAPAPPAAPAEVPAQKIKIAGKEYTVEELEAELKKEPAAPAAPQPEAPPAPTPPTAEEIKAAEAKFIADTAAALDTPLTEDQMDTILAGGKSAVALLQQIRKQDMATSILQARKGIASALDPIMNEIFAAVRPLVQQHQDLQRYQIKQQFADKHKDFVPHMARAEAVAEELVKLYPQQVQKMSAGQFIDEVARQTDLLLTTEHKRWFPAGNGNWRQTAAPTPPPAAAPLATPAPATPAALAAPAANLPMGAGAGGTRPAFAKSVAASMR